MKKFIWIQLLFLLGLPVYSAAFWYEENEILPVIKAAQTTPVYAEPDNWAKAVAEIPAGGEYTPMEYLLGGTNRNYSDWQGVFYREEGAAHLGFIQRHDYVHNEPIRFGDVVFSCKIDADEDKITFQAQSGDKIIAYAMPAKNTYAYPDFSVSHGSGLSNVKLRLRLSFSHDSCSTMYSYHVAWNGAKFLPLPVTMFAPMYSGESLIFPADGAPGNTILKSIWVQPDEEQEIYQHAVEIYKWDGEKTVLIDRTDIEENN